MNQKKQQECHFLNLVLDATGTPAGATIYFGERPDFCVKHNSDSIGLEVTRILDRVQKREDNERENVVKDAMILAKARGVPPLQVSILFNEEPPLTRANRTPLAQRIAEIVASNIPLEHSSEWRNDWTKLSSTPEKIVSINIFRLRDSADPCGHPISAGFATREFMPLLQEMIDEKAKDLQDYCNRFSECWLVVAAEGFQPSSLFCFSETMASHSFRSSFERVFFVEGFERRVTEVNVIVATRGEI